MKRMLIPGAGLILAGVAAGVVSAFALAGDNGGAPADLPLGIPDTGGVSADAGLNGVGDSVHRPVIGPIPVQPPIRSDEGIDPNECNMVHNIFACEGQPVPPAHGMVHADPGPVAPDGTVAHRNPDLFPDGEPPAGMLDLSASDRFLTGLTLLAREDLSQRLGVDLDSIQLVAAEMVEWSDTSLGNPEPGMFYAEVIVPGFVLTLEAQDETFEYHTNSTDRVVFVP